MLKTNGKMMIKTFTLAGVVSLGALFGANAAEAKEDQVHAKEKNNVVVTIDGTQAVTKGKVTNNPSVENKSKSQASVHASNSAKLYASENSAVKAGLKTDPTTEEEADAAQNVVEEAETVEESIEDTGSEAVEGIVEETEDALEEIENNADEEAANIQEEVSNVEEDITEEKKGLVLAAENKANAQASIHASDKAKEHANANSAVLAGLEVEVKNDIESKDETGEGSANEEEAVTEGAESLVETDVVEEEVTETTEAAVNEEVLTGVIEAETDYIEEETEKLEEPTIEENLSVHAEITVE